MSQSTLLTWLQLLHCRDASATAVLVAAYRSAPTPAQKVGALSPESQLDAAMSHYRHMPLPGLGFYHSVQARPAAPPPQAAAPSGQGSPSAVASTILLQVDILVMATY